MPPVLRNRVKNKPAPENMPPLRRSATEEIEQATDAASASLIAASFTGASYLSLLYFATRLLSLVLNQSLFRFITPDTFGIASVQFELIYATIMFLSREGIRLATLRSGIKQSSSPSSGKQENAIVKTVNLTWLCLPIGIVLSFLLRYIYLRQAVGERADYQVALWLYLLASWIELTAEPGFSLLQNQLLYGYRVSVEAVALTSRTLTTFVLVAFFDVGLIAFGAAQLLCSLFLLLGYSSFAVIGSPAGRVTWRTLLPRRLSHTKQTRLGLFDVELLSLAFKFTRQSFTKHCLTEADRIVLSFFSSFYDQGVYALVTNYGSLVSRFLFRPIEETLRVLFSKLNQKKANDDADGDLLESPVSACQIVDRRLLIADLYQTMLKLQIYIGLLFVCLGFNYSRIFVRIVLGGSWVHSSAASILSLYCFYILFLAINGISEAFVHAVATPPQIDSSNRWLVIFAIVNCILSVALVQLNSAGLIVANALTFGLRITHAFDFIDRFFGFRPWASLARARPPNLLLVLFAVAFMSTALTDYLFADAGRSGLAIHLGTGAFLGMAILYFMFVLGTYRLSCCTNECFLDIEKSATSSSD